MFQVSSLEPGWILLFLLDKAAEEFQTRYVFLWPIFKFNNSKMIPNVNRKQSVLLMLLICFLTSPYMWKYYETLKHSFEKSWIIRHLLIFQRIFYYQTEKSECLCVNKTEVNLRFWCSAEVILTNFSPVLCFIKKPAIYFALQNKWLVSIWHTTLG